jgi:hypothetical protein
MDLSQIKNLIPCAGERYIIIENGKPVVVLLCFGDYQKNFKFCGHYEEEKSFKQPEQLNSIKSVGTVDAAEKTTEKINEIPNEISMKKTNEDLTIDDLPF